MLTLITPELVTGLPPTEKMPPGIDRPTLVTPLPEALHDVAMVVKLPLASTCTQLPEANVAPTVANFVVVPDTVPDVGAPAPPPPSTGALSVSAAEDAIAVALEKYGMPPLVPAAVKPSVPEVVTGEPLTVKIAGAASATLVTVPVPAPVVHGLATVVRLPLASTWTQFPFANVVVLTVACLVVLPEIVPTIGAEPAPPPSTGMFNVRAADDPIVDALEKNGMPPLVPFAVTASVPAEMIGEPLTVKTPGMVNPTLVTDPPPVAVVGPKH